MFSEIFNALGIIGLIAIAGYYIRNECRYDVFEDEVDKKEYMYLLYYIAIQIVIGGGVLEWINRGWGIEASFDNISKNFMLYCSTQLIFIMICMYIYSRNTIKNYKQYRTNLPITNRLQTIVRNMKLVFQQKLTVNTGLYKICRAIYVFCKKTYKFIIQKLIMIELSILGILNGFIGAEILHYGQSERVPVYLTLLFIVSNVFVIFMVYVYLGLKDSNEIKKSNILIDLEIGKLEDELKHCITGTHNNIIEGYIIKQDDKFVVIAVPGKRIFKISQDKILAIY